jgi:hypothetical protein
MNCKKLPRHPRGAGCKTYEHLGYAKSNELAVAQIRNGMRHRHQFHVPRHGEK